MHLQFGENTNDNYFFSQPHQPFFVLAFTNAIVALLLFGLSYHGTIMFKISMFDFHYYSLTFLMFTPAFFAFLFTTFPRFSSTPAIEKKQYMSIFSLFYLGSVLFLLGSIVSPIFSTVGIFLLLIGHTMGTMILHRIYKITELEDKHDIYWILFAMYFGLIAHILAFIGLLFYPPFMGLSSEIAIYLYLFLLTFSVAQRMVPFFSHCAVKKDIKLMRNISILLIAHIILEGTWTNSSFVVDLFIAYILGKEVLSWSLPFPNPNPLLYILHISIYWVPIAFALSGVTNLLTMLFGISFMALDIHILILGFVFTMIIGFGTRVTLGHSGNKMYADKWTSKLFMGTQIVVISRLFVSIFSGLGWNFMPLFDIALASWLILLALWAFRFFPVLIKGKKITT